MGSDKVKIGLLHSQKGTMAFSESPLLEAELLAVDQINRQGGILGHQIESVIADGASDPETFAWEAEKLIVREGIKYIFGCWTSQSRKAVKKVVENHRALLWYPVQYEGFEESENIFYTGSSLNQQITPAIDWCLEQGWRNYYLLGSDYIYPITANKLIDSILKQTKGSIQKERYVPLGHTDFSEIIEELRSSLPHVVINTLNGDSNHHFFHQLSEAGLNAERLPILSTSIAEQELSRIGKPMKGHYTCWNYFQSLDNPLGLRFVQEFKKRYGKDRVVSDPIATAYSQIIMWNQIAESAGSLDIPAFCQSATNQTFDTPAGPMKTEANHHTAKKHVYIGKADGEANFEVVWQSDKYSQPLPWQGIETQQFPSSYLIKDILAKFPDIINVHSLLENTVKQRTKDLDKIKDKLRLVVQNMPMLMDAFDENLRVIVWNHECEKVTGYTAEEMIGNSNSLELLYPDPKYRKEIISELSALGQNFRNKEYTITCKDGSKKTIAWSNVSDVYPIPGWHTWAVGIDVTHRHKAEEALLESEQKFRELANSFDDMYFALDKDLKYTFWNKACEKFTNKTSDEMIGTSYFDFELNKGFEWMAEKYKEVIHSKESQCHEIPLTVNNRTFWYEIKAYPMQSGCAVLIKDISEKRKFEARIRRSEKMEAMGTLAGGIAHDFNNILGGMIGYTDMLLDDAEEGSIQRKNLKQIMKSAIRAKELVGQILTFSSQSPDQKSPIFIWKIVEEVIHLLRASIPTTIKIKTHLTQDTKPAIANATKIHEIVMNLCTNAAHAMQDKGILNISHEEIYIESELKGRAGVSPPGLYSVITIRDNGCGMPKDVLEHIFEPYFTTKNLGEGTGMGLAVVFGAIKYHKGNIKVRSEPKKGTTFEIYIPKSDVEIEKENEYPKEVPQGTERILFIDDEEILRDLGEDILTQLGYQVDTVSNGLTAIEKFQAAPDAYDLIITDQTMPEMTGLELSKRILSIRPNIPILLTTGYSKSINKTIIKSTGLKGLIPKPFRKIDIANKIREILETPISNEQ